MGGGRDAELHLHARNRRVDVSLEEAVGGQGRRGAAPSSVAKFKREMSHSSRAAPDKLARSSGAFTIFRMRVRKELGSW